MALVTGFLFGVFFQKSRVFETATIRGQMVFKRWVMLKLFLSAAGTGSLVCGLISHFNPKLYEIVREKYRGSCDRSFAYALVLGSLLLGVGMTISAACPGMVLAQIGSGQPNSIWVVVGCLVAALVYGGVESSIREGIVKKGFIVPKDKRFVDELLGLPKNRVVALDMGMVVGCWIGVCIIEFFFPWNSDLEVDVQNSADCSISNPFECRQWPPQLAGTFVGLLQLPLIFTFQTCMGTSTAYQSLIAIPLMIAGKHKVEAKSKLAYMAMFAPTNVALQWQIFYCGAALLGAYTAASSPATTNYGETPGLPPFTCFAGGFLMVFGSRLAAGCTSAHGLSGMPLMVVHSFIAVPALFGGGIISAYIIQAIVGGTSNFIPHAGATM